MKKKYETPVCAMTYFAIADIITESGPDDFVDDPGDWLDLED